MVKLTMPSEYGPLSLRDTDSDPPEINLPQMQFEDADLVIQLGPKPEEWLLLHSSVLRASSTYFNRSLFQEWDHTMSGSIKILHPNTGQQVSMWCRPLKYIDGTYLLEGKGVTTNTHANVTLFSESTLAQPKWPRFFTSEDPKDRSKRALHILFALLYGARLECHQICMSSKPEWDSIGTDDINHDIFFTLVATCAYAEYWDCLDMIGPAALAVMQSAPDYWEAVAEHPTRHLAFAIKVQSTELYYDALRHVAVKSYENDNWQVLSDLTGTTERALCQFYEHALALQGPLMYDDRLRKVTDDLRALQLQETRAKRYMEGWGWVRTRFLDRIRHKWDGIVKQTKDKCAVHYVARAIFGEYIVYMLQGQKIYGGVRARKAGNILHLLHDIQQAAKDEDPSSLFEDATSDHLADIFNFSSSQKEELKYCLDQLELQANNLITEAFPVVTETQLYAGHAQPCTKSRTKCANFSGRHSAYVSVPDETPWGQTTGGHSDPSNRKVFVDKNISVADASSEWIAALAQHFEGVSEEDDQEAEAEPTVEREDGFEAQVHEDDEAGHW